MKKVVIVSMLLLILFTCRHAFAASEFRQRELIHKYVNYPIEDWEKLTKVNRDLVDENLLIMVKSMMDGVIGKSIEKNPRSDDIPSEAFLFAYLADYVGKKIRKPEQNRFYLARLCERKGRLDKAADMCNNILMNEPKNVEVMTFQAELFERMNMPNEAYGIYTNILKLDKNNKQAMFRLALLNMELARYKDSMELFRRLLKVDPDNQVARRFVDMYDGKIKGNTPDVQRNEQAIQHFLLAEKMFKGGNYQDAAVEYSNAIEADPGFAKAYVYLGVTLMRQKKYDSAIGVLETAVKMDAKDPEAYHMIGLAYERQYNFNPDVKFLDLAIENYKKALEVDKDYFKAADDLQRVQQRRQSLQDNGEGKQNPETPEKE